MIIEIDLQSPEGDGKEDMMLQKIVLRCSFDGEQKPTFNWGSLMHGALMELIPADTADFLHVENLRPFSQYIIPKSDNEVEWHIGVWEDTVGDAIAKAVMPLSQIMLKDKCAALKILNAARSVESERDFLSRFFTAERPSRRYTLEFLTPCTHKSNNEYTIFPTPKLIIQSLHSRFCAFVQDFSIDDKGIMLQLADHIRITRYNLRSVNYHLKGTYITGYMGHVILSISGPEQLARLAGMLLSFAKYSGVGIKTSLGMGGCHVEQLISSH